MKTNHTPKNTEMAKWYDKAAYGYFDDSKTQTKNPYCLAESDWFVVQNGDQVDIHKIDYTQARELTVACNVGEHAAELVRRWNAHAELLEVCQMAASSIKVDPMALLEAARAAVKKVTQ
jgi:hypothetical protein